MDLCQLIIHIILNPILNYQLKTDFVYILKQYILLLLFLHYNFLTLSKFLFLNNLLQVLKYILYLFFLKILFLIPEFRLARSRFLEKIKTHFRIYLLKISNFYLAYFFWKFNLFLERNLFFNKF